MNQNNSSKALFFDIDGTLLSFQTHQVPTSALEALKQAHHNGHLIFIATGRAATDLHEISCIPYDAVIALNGSECLQKDGSPIFRQTIPTEDFQKCLELAEIYQFPIALETNEGVLVNRVNSTVIELAQLVNHEIPRVVDIEKEFTRLPCCQICFYCDKEIEKKVMKELPNLTATRWHPIFTDINVKGISKASGIRELARHYHFNLQDTFAFGDGGNDIPMLQQAGTGVAMGNASNEVKTAADYITASVDEDGILQALRHFHLIQE